MNSSASFASLSLQPQLLTNLTSLGYTAMTPIQAQSLPPILAGSDVIGRAKTGSGKTVSYGLGILENIDIDQLVIQALVICPTRELSEQVATELRSLARTLPNIKMTTLCGGVPTREQIKSLAHGAHIIVGTPGRLQDMLDKESLTLDQLKILVLDEADRMLEMGFADAVSKIVSQAPKQRQTLLFSATYPDTIERIAQKVMTSPLMVKAGDDDHEGSTIEQFFYHVNDDDDRLKALQLLVLKHQPPSTLVFCTTKKDCQQLANQLRQAGFSALAIHGDLDQKERDQALVQFANRSISLLVATDVASRGLDVDDIDWVINYQLASDADIHTHRIGRTGRAGKAGVAHSFYTDKEQFKLGLFDCDKPHHQGVLPSTDTLKQSPHKPLNATIRIDSGKKQKIRPGDILGALTGKEGIKGDEVGKINVHNNWSYVAVNRQVVKPALIKLTQGKLKGRSARAKII